MALTRLAGRWQNVAHQLRGRVHLQGHARGYTNEYERQLSGGLHSEYIGVNNIRIHYSRTGIGDHTILLLPGALGSAYTDFMPQLAGLNKDVFQLVCFDPRGYGKSIPPKRDWPLEFLQRDAEDAAQMMKNLGYTKFSILGWSDGGITGMIIAGQFPELVHKMVVWGANSYVTENDMKCYRAIEDISKWSERMRKPFIEIYGEEYFQRQWSNWLKAYECYLTKRKGDICNGELSKIQCPTLILHGEQDPLVFQEHPDYLHANIKGSRLVTIPKAKHNLHLHYPDVFNKLVTEFMSKG